ncbi:MAG: SUMF1/EgtB/PvdO family nonheme iron enzyme [Polyangiaceae bacterium]
MIANPSAARWALTAAILVAPLPALAGELELKLAGGDEKLVVVEIPAGTFDQGSGPTEQGRGPDESLRKVTLTKPFFISKTLVTKGQFAQFVADTKYATEAEKGTSGGYGIESGKLVQKKQYTWQNPGFSQTDKHPVVIVTYADAQAFARWVSAQYPTEYVARLPTEAEFEYAARGEKPKGAYFWGTDKAQAAANAWFAPNAGSSTHPVGEKPANAYGLFDMAGNVWQWCEDYYGPLGDSPVTDFLQSSPVTWAQSDKPRRVLRGGSFLTTDAFKLRTAARYRADGGSRNADFGFRLVLTRRGPGDPPATGTGTGTAGPNKLKTVGSGGRPSPAAPPPHNPPASNSGSGLWIVFVILTLGLGLVLIIVLATRKSRPSQPRYSTRIAGDGFWVSGAGGPIRYSVRRPDGMFDRGQTVLSNPAGTFVYTGFRPSHVNCEPDYGPTYGASYDNSSTSYGSSSSYDSSSSSGSSGWPSAY